MVVKGKHMINQAFIDMWETYKLVEEQNALIEDTIGSLFYDFQGIFRNEQLQDSIIRSMAACYSTHYQDKEDLVDWIIWFIYDKPDGPFTITVDSHNYIIDTINDLQDFFERKMFYEDLL